MERAEHTGFLRLVTELPVPEALAAFAPLTPLAMDSDRYGAQSQSVSGRTPQPLAWRELEGATSQQGDALLAACRQHFSRTSCLGVSPLRQPRALFFDMDSTVIREESIVELAREAGLAEPVARVTEAAMAGEIDFATALYQRVALLEGLPVGIVERVRQRLRLMPGVEVLVPWAAQRGVPAFLISGGFSILAQDVAGRLGFAGAHAHQLEEREGKLTGRIAGPIVDANAKRDFVLRTCARLGLDPKEVAAIGDGANDLSMLQISGVAVGIAPKDILWTHLHAVADHHAFLGPLLFGAAWTRP